MLFIRRCKKRAGDMISAAVQDGEGTRSEMDGTTECQSITSVPPYEMGDNSLRPELDSRVDRYGEPLPQEGRIPRNATISRILQHVSVRSFIPDKKLPEGTLEILMAAAQSASTGSMLQSWSAVAITDTECKNHIATLSGEQDFIRQAPLFILLCADLSRLHNASDHHGRPGDGAGLERIDLFIMSTIDVAMAAQNASIAAESLGLGICYVGGARNNTRELSDYLALPLHVVGLFGMAVGKAKPEHINAHKPRLPMNGVMHIDVWNGEERLKRIERYEEILQKHYERHNKLGRPAWTATLANFVKSGDLDGRGRMRHVLDLQGFKFT
ncbi:hypothetical protein NW768_011233 [Fusarium equiseti]|uniref:Nitroreductase domain-containing protein n=1 Tax=Fusarium equiseti TaxID=61235 RepID=A0ABQ8QYL8_FUSEQ|nr:hypothetical protein NW768_011233 [Fusarium equiseti]